MNITTLCITGAGTGDNRVLTFIYYPSHDRPWVYKVSDSTGTNGTFYSSSVDKMFDLLDSSNITYAADLPETLASEARRYDAEISIRDFNTKLKFGVV